MSTIHAEVYREFRETVRRFAVEKVAPYAALVDQEKRPPFEAYKASLELGLPGLPYPADLGGQDGDIYAQVITIEELARACASTAITISSCWSMIAVVLNGTEAQKREIVPQIAGGDARCAWGLTEPRGGSDLMGITTAATRATGGWRLNGTKRFITNGGWADWYLIFARTGEKEFGLFLVHKSNPGVSFGAPERKMGLRGSPTADVILDNCFVSDAYLLGDPTKGAEYINGLLVISRLKISAHALGIAQGALDEAVKYTTEREQFGQPISRYQMLRGMVADMAIKIESGRAVLHRAVELCAAGDASARHYASIAKVLCSDAAMSVTTDALQLHGGYGYLEDYPIERMMRDAKVTQIWEGTNQIQRLIIAKDVYARY